MLCPKYQRDPLPPEQNYPVYNNDNKFYTSAFILGVEKRALYKNDQQERMEHQRQVKESMEKKNQFVLYFTYSVSRGLTLDTHFARSARSTITTTTLTSARKNTDSRLKKAFIMGIFITSPCSSKICGRDRRRKQMRRRRICSCRTLASRNRKEFRWQRRVSIRRKALPKSRTLWRRNRNKMNSRIILRRDKSKRIVSRARKQRKLCKKPQKGHQWSPFSQNKPRGRSWLFMKTSLNIVLLSQRSPLRNSRVKSQTDTTNSGIS